MVDFWLLFCWECGIRASCSLARPISVCLDLGGPGLLLSDFFLTPASEISKNSKNQKMEPQKWFPCRHNSYINHRNGKHEKLFLWRTWGDLNFRDVAISRTNHRNVSAQECPISELSVTALFWWAKGRRSLGPPKPRPVSQRICKVFIGNRLESLLVSSEN